MGAPSTQLSTGAVDFAIAWVPKALASREQGAAITDVGQIFQRSGTLQVSWADSNIKAPADLKGKKVGNWGFGNEFELFAGMTGDFTPLHVDHEYARQTPFGKPIAHGLLGLSVMAGLSSRCPAMHTAAFLRVREWQFVRPIHIGDTVHVETQVTERQPHGRQRGLIVWRRRLVNQHGEAVQEGVLETLVLVSASRKMVPR